MKKVVIYVGILAVYIIISFTFIIFSAQNVIMPISGIPLWLGNLIFCFFIGLYIYFELNDKNYNKNKKVVIKKVLTKQKK